jgi:protease-4
VSRACVGALGLVVALTAGCNGRARTTSPSTRAAPNGAGAVVELDLRRGLPEASAATLLGQTRRNSLVDLVRVLVIVGGAKTTQAIFVRLGTTRVDLAAASEVGRLLLSLRQSGKPIVCHADDYGNGSLMLAAQACSQIWLSPAGSVDSVGVAAQLIYGRELLSKLNVDVDFLQIGKYKGAEEPFTRDGPSPEARASMEGMLRGLRAAWVDTIVEGRSKPELAAAVEAGPFSADEARDRGLIDSVGFADEALTEAKRLGKTKHTRVSFGDNAESLPPVSRGLIRVFRAVSGASREGEPHVAIVRAVGAITMSTEPRLPLGPTSGITERALGATIERLTDDASVRAVVIRIDSPGGSALASDLLWKRLMTLRAKKPVVFSIGKMAASGGYYLASTGTKIIAEPVSILGSIGVVGGKLSFGKTLASVGVHVETIAAAPEPYGGRAVYMSPFEPWDDATRERVRATMTRIYELFLDRVAEGRAMPREAVASSAEGRVFAGAEAKQRGLVDELGGVDRAIALARELAKLPSDAPVRVVSDGGGLLDWLSGGDDTEARVKASAAHELATLASSSLGDLAPELAGFIGSAAPLAVGERALTALPFAVVVR